jgi:hypothetical protein
MANLRLPQLVLLVLSALLALALAAPAPRQVDNPPPALPKNNLTDKLNRLQDKISVILPNGVQFPVQANQVTVLSRSRFSLSFQFPTSVFALY